MDPLGIDVADGQYPRSDAFLTIGDASSGGLSWRYIPGAHVYHGNVVEVLPLGANNQLTTVKVEGNATTFINNGTSYVNASGTGATLTKTASNYIFTDDDGTIYTYTWTYQASYGSPAVAPSNIGPLVSIQKPNGTLITITGNTLNGGGTTVVSNQGYALKVVNSAGVTTVYAVNLSAHSCDTSINCDAYDGSITIQNVSNPAAPDTFGSASGTVDQVTDPAGNNWQYEVGYSSDIVDRNGNENFGAKAIWYFKDPTWYAVTVLYDSAGRIVSFADPRGTFSWDYNGQTEQQAYTDFNRNLIVRDPASTIIYSAYAQYKHSTISWMKNPLNNQTSYGFVTNSVVISGIGSNNYTRLNTVTHPEGDYYTYTYDARGNVTQTVSTPKPGSGLSAVTVYQAGYDTTCANLKTCNQPNWTKDAKGNQTDYTYDATHGGVLTVTLPADSAGYRKRTYNTYTAYDTGNGLIYRLTRTETCGLSSAQLTLTACPALSSTEVVTTSYGTSSTAPYTYKTFLPYQVTKTDGAASLTATTTYAYDKIGNVVSVDGPLAGTGDTSYKTYDANRRVIFEIGVDPDGTGSLKRAIVKHTYDGAGRETLTQTGTGSATDGSDFVVSSFTRNTYDLAGRLVKTEVGQP